jgi:RNA polymerase sigma factor (sigma-70 family)
MPNASCDLRPLTPEPAPTPEADDQALIRRLATRDPHAFEQLYQRYAQRLQGYLRRLLPSHVLPEDVLHEVMLLVWQQAERFDPSKPLLPWLFGLARHKALEAQRAARPRPTLPPDTTSEPAAEALELGVARQELACAVMQALGDLSPAERQVVELTYYHDLSYPEIAGLVACSVNTVKARMARGRRHLAPHLAALVLAPDLAAHHPHARRTHRRAGASRSTCL